MGEFYRSEREKADQGGGYCLQASLLEASAYLGGRTTNLESIIPDPTVHTSQLLDAIESGCKTLGIRVKRILSNPSHAELMGSTSKVKVEKVTGAQSADIPVVILMSREKGSGHAECNDGSEEAQRRITGLERNGWRIIMTIEFEPKAE